MEERGPEVSQHWWQSFFADVVVDMWLATVPEEHTQAEVEFVRKMLQVSPPARLLDGPCGGGRHSLPLAAAGYRVTGVDVSPDFITAARSRATAGGSQATFLQRSLREIPWTGEFDGALCFGNSFGYDDDAGNAAILDAIFRSLKPGARFVLDYPMVLEARLPKFQERNWMQVEDIFFLEDEHYDHVGGRTVTEYTFIRDGKVVKRTACHRAYTYREIYGMLERAGFVDIQSYGTLTGEPFRLGSAGLYLIGAKAGSA